MAATFRPARKGGVTVTFSADEERVLRQVFEQMLELLGVGEQDEVAEADPLAAVVGIGTATAAPEDPALARLFPDGYTGDDEAAADFRRYTEPGLRAAKKAAARTVLATLAVGKVHLDEEQADSWLRALNDARLVLGERLQVTEDWEELVTTLLAAAPEDPRLPLLAVYDRLSGLQESLVRALW